MKSLRVICILIGLPLVANMPVCAKTISPLQYGYEKAKTGEERYAVLYKTHCEAVRLGADVDYSGLKEIELTIPAHAKSIPLTDYNDFAGVSFTVTNTSYNFFLFSRTFELEPVKVSKGMIKRGSYLTVKKKTHGRVLLVIEDKTPWVANRKGYNYSAIRKDALIVENGRAVNAPTCGYKSKQSQPVAFFREVNGKGTIVKNLTFKRTAQSENITYLLKISNEDNVRIENIVTYTPESTLKADAIFKIENSTNIRFINVQINGTYSGMDEYGYGVNLENVYNVQFDHFYGNGKWGVFGNNNVNTVIFRNSRMNRFDIHCYGKDVTFENCEFFDLYNQFSSLYGNLVFKHCTFTNFIPLSMEMSYNAYTGFDVHLEDCTFNTTSQRHSLISAGRMDEAGGGRSELSALCWPNVYIKDLAVNAGYGANPLYVFVTVGDQQLRNVEYLSEVKIDGLVYNTTDAVSHIKSVSLCNNEVVSTEKMDIQLSNIKLVDTQAIQSDSSPEGKFYIPIKQVKGKQHKVRVENSVLEVIER